ncbi:TetR/AcrR family transcriptional regulator [Aeromicrobium phragmitis]|uniref:TetR/AcrR family transcriptional regulator n=1 Tax=Aeromicrobium phragmitis TaxID=2478914 RepID=A0A3L8PLR0_9ACTN|nr:TetR/AcrR family transcriptional regulator [Aeromicrobium phragmitis]RLV56164.1 TetR/AcrR family transcriptional regulator [Aeromicrobium phragmitis]
MRTVDPARHAARRAQILAGAATAFARKGYDRTTVKDICMSAGVGSGTLFHYFTDKRAIFHAILEADRDQLLADLADVDMRDPLSAFWHVVERTTTDLRDPMAGAMVLAILGQVTVDPAVGEILGAGDTAAHAVLAELIGRLQEAGQADPAWDPAHAATWVQTMTDGLYLRCGDEGFDADVELAQLRLVLTRMLDVRTR